MNALKVALGAFVAASLAGSFACSVEKGELVREVTATRAAPGLFRTDGVSRVFEKRCGSLDCHGSTARNMRIYSSEGLRLLTPDASLGPGLGDTTLDEITANYQSIMTLEPELSNDVVNGGDPYQLLVLKKPLELERHKGGQSIRRGDDAERCIVSWLKRDALNALDVGACQRAAIFPKE